MAYLPSRWDPGDEATGPQMDEVTTVGSFPTVRTMRGRSVRLGHPNAGTSRAPIPPTRLAGRRISRIRMRARSALSRSEKHAGYRRLGRGLRLPARIARDAQVQSPGPCLGEQEIGIFLAHASRGLRH